MVSISDGNSKIGNIPSVSLPSIITCIECECNTKCYANKIERLRPKVRNAYAKNYQILREQPDVYWREVESAIMRSLFFRFHVSGDIVDDSYFEHMVDIAKRNPHCEIMCFTKKYAIVNHYIENNGDSIPSNLHIIFSAWIGLQMTNPFLFPEAHVRYKDGTTAANTDAKICNGNCESCAVTEGGCWSLTKGDQVLFEEH